MESNKGARFVSLSYYIYLLCQIVYTYYLQDVLQYEQLLGI